jgi:hypothetical protein
LRLRGGFLGGGSGAKHKAVYFFSKDGRYLPAFSDVECTCDVSSCKLRSYWFSWNAGMHMRKLSENHDVARSDGDASMKAVLGGKGANLAEMSKIGLSVPPGFTISTEV